MLRFLLGALGFLGVVLLQLLISILASDIHRNAGRTATSLVRCLAAILEPPEEAAFIAHWESRLANGSRTGLRLLLLCAQVIVRFPAALLKSRVGLSLLAFNAAPILAGTAVLMTGLEGRLSPVWLVSFGVSAWVGWRVWENLAGPHPGISLLLPGALAALLLFLVVVVGSVLWSTTGNSVFLAWGSIGAISIPAVTTMVFSALIAWR